MTLPRFEKTKPKVARLKINGFGEEGDEALPIGEVRYMIVEVRVAGVEHKEEKKVGVVRVHKANIIRHAPVPDIDSAVAILDAEEERRRQAEAEAEEARRLAEEKEQGVQRLTDTLDDDEGSTPA